MVMCMQRDKRIYLLNAIKRHVCTFRFTNRRLNAVALLANTASMCLRAGMLAQC